MRKRHYYCLWVCALFLPALLSGCAVGNAAHVAARNRPSGSASPAASTTGAKFRDVAHEAGLRYYWAIGPTHLTIFEMVGNGCAFLDYNNDGNLDILLVGTKLALYKGDGHGHFTDVTHETGLDQFHGHFLGCATGDYDNDGYEDIYVTGYRCGLLLHNEKGRRFTDATRKMGLPPQRWATSAAFADIDGDGRLDLYIGNYLQLEAHTHDLLHETDTLDHGVSPDDYKAEYGVFYRNEGNRFRDVTKEWLADKRHIEGKTLGVAVADFDGSGRQSIALANDERPGDLLCNVGGKFASIAKRAGVAYGQSRNHNLHGGMGIDWGDFENAGKLDLIVTTSRYEAKTLYHNLGGRLFADVSQHVGLQSSYLNTSFGVKFLDYDNDGFLDIIFANGEVDDDLSHLDPVETFKQPTRLYHNIDGKRFEDLSAVAGPDLQKQLMGRGLAIGDFDNDGRMDVLVVDSDGAPLLLHNETPAVGHWLLCNLRGVKSNRDGLGALVTADTGDKRLLRLCTTGGSYMSASDRRVHFGLGKATSATLSVKWPSGRTDIYRNVAADRVVTLVEGESKAH